MLALAGVVVSVMALRVHRMDPNAAPPCAVSEKWDCGTVNHSKYSVFPPIGFDEKPGAVHIPVSIFGIVGYALIAIFALLGRLRVVLELARIGFFFAAFLTYVEAYIIEMWCIYCVWSQVTISAILLCTIAALVFEHRKKRGMERVVAPV